jgi:hypothetical protein
MNFNLKYSIFSTAAAIFIMGSASVADATQLRGGGLDAHNSRGLELDLSEVPDEDIVAIVSFDNEDDGDSLEGLEAQGQSRLKSFDVDGPFDWSASASDFIAASESFEDDNEVDSLESYRSYHGWGNNCPIPKNNPVGKSCRSFVPHPDTRPEAIFQCKYPNVYHDHRVLYFHCTNTNRNPQWTYAIRNN